MDKLPYEVQTSSKKLLKKIYAAFPGSDAPDILSDIEAFARKCMECAGHSGYDLDLALNVIVSNLGTAKTYAETMIRNGSAFDSRRIEPEAALKETVDLARNIIDKLDLVLNFVERVREETKEVKGLAHHV